MSLFSHISQHRNLYNSNVISSSNLFCPTHKLFFKSHEKQCNMCEKTHSAEIYHRKQQRKRMVKCPSCNSNNIGIGESLSCFLNSKAECIKRYKCFECNALIELKTPIPEGKVASSMCLPFKDYSKHLDV